MAQIQPFVSGEKVTAIKMNSLVDAANAVSNKQDKPTITDYNSQMAGHADKIAYGKCYKSGNIVTLFVKSMPTIAGDWYDYYYLPYASDSNYLNCVNLSYVNGNKYNVYLESDNLKLKIDKSSGTGFDGNPIGFTIQYLSAQ